MSREEDKGNITNLPIAGVLHARNALQFERRICSEQDLWGILDGSSPSINEFLYKDLSEDPICLFSENSTKYHSDPVMASLDKNCLLVSVMNGHNLATFSDTLWSLFRCKSRCLFLQFMMLVKCVFKWCSHRIALQKGDPSNQVVPCFFIFRQALQVNLHGEVISILRRDNVRAIFSFKDLLGTILQELIKALYLDRYENLSLGFGSRDMEGDAIKVGNCLVNINGRLSG